MKWCQLFVILRIDGSFFKTSDSPGSYHYNIKLWQIILSNRYRKMWVIKILLKEWWNGYIDMSSKMREKSSIHETLTQKHNNTK